MPNNNYWKDDNPEFLRALQSAGDSEYFKGDTPSFEAALFASGSGIPGNRRGILLGGPMQRDERRRLARTQSLFHDTAITPDNMPYQLRGHIYGGAHLNNRARFVTTVYMLNNGISPEKVKKFFEIRNDYDYSAWNQIKWLINKWQMREWNYKSWQSYNDER